jgi:uncharacterized protein YbaP (TraB family)
MTMLLRRLLTLVLLLALPGAAAARPALWKVSDADTTVWLFGTVHALPKGTGWYDGRTADAFEHSDTLVTEIIDKNPEQMRAVVQASAMLPEGRSLRAMMTARQRAAFERALAANKMPPAALDRYQPWYAAVALATLPLLTSGYDPANGVDATLGAKAATLKLAHEALETPEYQLSLFGSLPMPVQKRYLSQVVRNLPKLKGELTAIIASWQAGNASRLAKLMNDDEDDPALKDKLLIGRNKAWARWISARMAKPGAVFVAVGAGHLAGPGSVQDQLRALGLKAVRVQ